VDDAAEDVAVAAELPIPPPKQGGHLATIASRDKANSLSSKTPLTKRPAGEGKGTEKRRARREGEESKGVREDTRREGSDKRKTTAKRISTSPCRYSTDRF